MTTNWMGSAITPITFRYMLTVKERYNPLNYFRMRNMEEIGFFFVDVENPARNRNLCAEMMRKLKIKVSETRRKKLKST